MIQEVAGDILLSKAGAVVHGIAPNDHFTNGLALVLRERWPGMYKDFRHYCQVSSPKPGELWTWSGPGVRIVSLFTQDPAATQDSTPGKAHLENVNHCLKALRHAITTEKFKSLALPRLATGVGRLDWKDVRPLIDKHLGDAPILIYVYSTYQPGIQAQETV